tara:strand:- start:2600 stop:3031 length:432 start_codon:yes stop_codon:yes gene_type:complete
MSDAMTNYLENVLINHVIRNTAYTTPGTSIYVGLIGYYESGGTNGGETGKTASKEKSGGSYARVQVTAWTSPIDVGTSGSITNTAAITFPTATGDWGHVSGVFIADHATAGNMLLHGSLTSPREVKSGDVFKFNATDLDISFS